MDFQRYNNMKKKIKNFIKKMGDKYCSYWDYQRDNDVPEKVREYMDGLEGDIVKMATKQKVSVLDLNSEMSCGYDVDTLDDYLSKCVLPKSVCNFASKSQCDWEFIFDMFMEAEKNNEVASFQLAEGRGYVNYKSAYRTMTSDYDEFKNIVGYELEEWAYACSTTIRSILLTNDFFVLGNELGAKFFDDYLEEIEREYKDGGILKLVSLYKKALYGDNEAVITSGLECGEKKTVNEKYREEYEEMKEDLVVDIINHVEEKGYSICTKCMPRNVEVFEDMSGCDEAEIIDLYNRALKIAEDFNFVITYFGDDIVLVRDYNEMCELLDAVYFEGFELDNNSNGLAKAYYIKWLAKKSGKTVEDYWNNMIEILFALSKVGIPVDDAVENVLNTISGIAYVALEKGVHSSCSFYYREVYSIRVELSDIYRKMVG